MHCIVTCKGVGTNSRVWGPSHHLPCYYIQYIDRAHLCGLHTAQKFAKVHYYLYLTTNSPSYTAVYAAYHMEGNFGSGKIWRLACQFVFDEIKFG